MSTKWLGKWELQRTGIWMDSLRCGLQVLISSVLFPGGSLLSFIVCKRSISIPILSFHFILVTWTLGCCSWKSGCRFCERRLKDVFRGGEFTPWDYEIDDGETCTNATAEQTNLARLQLQPLFTHTQRPTVSKFIMLRVVSNRILSQSRVASRAFSSAVAEASTGAGAPSVMDSIVQLNFVDPSGARRSVPSYIGELSFYWIYCLSKWKIEWDLFLHRGDDIVANKKSPPLLCIPTSFQASQSTKHAKWTE